MTPAGVLYSQIIMMTKCFLVLCLQFDYGGEEGDGGDEMDDFEAQMRALQEQL